ncbi:MAG: hypothetical protein V3T58_03190 [Candidatus Hydrothermarchaeales archaeon]
MTVQLKLNIDDALARKFKESVLAKHGKLELSVEGEEALRLYLKHHKFLTMTPKKDPILRIIGSCKSRGKADAVEDLKKLEHGVL